MANLYYCVLSLISPKLNTQVRYHKVFHRKLDLKNPRDFPAKLCWLKLRLYMKNPLVIQCADKYAVRSFIEKMGCADSLNELYGVWDDPKEIPWDKLPNQFVLKWNFGSGYVIVCNDKKNFNVSQALKKLRSWKKAKPWLLFAELQYKYAPKKIICEKYLDTLDSLPYDYKVYCFNGEPKCILVMWDRGANIKACFMTPEWRFISFSQRKKYANLSLDQIPKKPESLTQMIEKSRKLASPFPFVRVDWYDYKGKAIFGETTFTPSACCNVSETLIDGKDMGDLLQLPKVN